MNGLAMRVPPRLAPWWVVLETTGRRSGQPRRVPLARGPVEADVTRLIAVHGRQAAFVRNVLAQPSVRLRIGGRWRGGIATIEPFDDSRLAGFSFYARMGPRTLGIEPVFIRVELDP
jgi:deazaflavin-dependent oxidoreductase (nitroreductase family)